MYDFVPVVCITYTLRHEIHLRLINIVDVFANLLSLLLFAKGNSTRNTLHTSNVRKGGPAGSVPSSPFVMKSQL